MNEREQKIIQLARGFLNQLSEQRPLDESTIDANFLFRFESAWCDWISKIRQMMWAMLGESNNIPLSSEDGARWLIHLETNKSLMVGVDITPNGSRLIMTTDTGNYRCCFDLELREKYEAVIKYTLMSGKTAEIEQLNQQVWLEANQTAKIRDELLRLAQAYHLIPTTEDETLKYAPIEITERFQSVVTWVIWGKVVPSFLWPKTILLESKTDKKIKRTLRPHKWSEHIFPTTEPRIRLDTRIRTWTIYYLTRRGGGERYEQPAVDLWNQEFPERTIEFLANYRKERDRLLKHGSEK